MSKKPSAAVGEPFDAAYYARYYEHGATLVQDAARVAELASWVVGLVEWFAGPVETVLDVGAGAGLWRDWFRAHRPRVRYRSTEVSEHACRAYGHEQRDIATFRAKERFDLIVCQGVLPYLDDDDAQKAMENLAAMCGGFLYLEAITKRDVREVCDLERTDTDVHLRSARFYRRALAPHFREVGAGLFCARRCDALFYELEAQP